MNWSTVYTGTHLLYITNSIDECIDRIVCTYLIIYMNAFPGPDNLYIINSIDKCKTNRVTYKIK